MTLWLLTSWLLVLSVPALADGPVNNPEHLRDRLWYAVQCPETFPGFRSVLRADWESGGLRFGKAPSSAQAVEAYVRSRIEPFSNGIWRDVLWRSKADRNFYDWIPEVALNKDLYKPDINHFPGYFHEGCDYLPLAAQVEGHFIGAAAAMNSLPAFDQFLALVNLKPFWFDEYFYAGEWISNNVASSAVGRLLSDGPALTPREFYQATKVLRKGTFDFFDCKFAGSGLDHPLACAEAYDYSDSPLATGADGKPLTTNYFFDLESPNFPLLLGAGATTFHPNGGIASVVLKNPRGGGAPPDLVRMRLSLTNPGRGRAFLDQKDAKQFFFDDSGELRAAENLLRSPGGEIVYQSAEPQEVSYQDEDQGDFQYALEKGMIWKDAKGRILGGQLAKNIIIHSHGYPFILCEGTFALFSTDGTLRTALGHSGDNALEDCFNHKGEREFTFSRGERVVREDRTSHEYAFLAGVEPNGGWLSFDEKTGPDALEPILSYKGAPDCAIRKERHPGYTVDYRVPHNCFYFVRYSVRH
ncbi:MAG: hypothetical protein ACXVC0_17955 [Bdellovibrionota bacterium]